ncbi:Dual specificity testis-specific protein kinase 2 [Bulinus truncatus]|nr:Dual specificity testis-specific protein kinase 2 [Bulinus truncatus]
MKITLKEYMKMSDNKVDKDQVGKPVLRHLRRSKTINVSHFGGSDGQTANEGFNDGNEKKRSPSPVPQPTSSCQALKHAVSALTRIDDFILEELGDGFFANVYKATHKVTNEEMVMKVNKDSANRSSALREVQLMNKLSHPNILRFLGVCVHEGQLHALTEYISGGTLETLLANKDEELPWTLRIKLSLDIAKGMHYLHLEGVFHRDLTSKNILIKKGENRNYQAVIADFGLATKIPEPNTEPLPSVGCPWWMAPEVIHGKFYDQRADLFSYGIILLEITARIEADPETMPRTKNFGVDYIKICEMVDYCPLDFLQLAFKCCQILPELRPSSSVIVTNLERIYKNLHTNSQNNSGRIHKRSRSEDNIIQSSDSLTGDELLMTPQIIAQAMTKDDPHYCPAIANPFASISKFKDGRKLLEFPKQRKCSISNNGFAMLCGRHADNMTSSFNGSYIFTKPESQSLPCSPIMLRKAAEKLHQASLHGSDAVEPVVEHDLTFSASSDNQEIGDMSPAAEKRIRFGCNRTRSLGSLDFFNPLGLSSVGKIRQKQYQSNHVDKKGYCNRENARIRESSVEDQLLIGLGDSTDDLNENSVYSDCMVHLRNSVNSGSFRSLSSEQDKTSGVAQFDSCDLDDTSGAGPFGSCEESVSCCSLSSFVSCSETEEQENQDSVLVRNQSLGVKLGNGQDADHSKPCIANESGSYDPDHFRKDIIVDLCADKTVESQDLIITKL